VRVWTKENLLFGAAGFLVFALNSIFITFSLLFFEEAGFSETQIGFMLSLTVIVSMLSQVATGYLSDNVLTIKKIMLIDIAVTAVVALLMIPVQQSYALTFVLYAFFSLTGRMIGPMLDGYITRMAQLRSGLDFGFTRGLSSIGWAFAAIVGGWLIRGIGIHMMFVLHTIFAVAAFVMVAQLEDVPLNKKEIKDGRAQSESFADAAKAVLRTRGFLVTTMACLLLSTGIYVVHSIFALIVTHVGGTSGDVGLGIFFLALSEVPILWNYHRIARRVKNGHLIVLSCLTYALKAGLLIAFQSVSGVVFLQLMQSVTYAVFLPAILRFMQSLLPERYMSTGIMMWLAIYGSGSQIIGSVLGGYLLENRGYVPLHAASVAFCLAGAVVMVYAVKRYAKNETTAGIS